MTWRISIWHPHFARLYIPNCVLEWLPFFTTILSWIVSMSECNETQNFTFLLITEDTFFANSRLENVLPLVRISMIAFGCSETQRSNILMKSFLRSVGSPPVMHICSRCFDWSRSSTWLASLTRRWSCLCGGWGHIKQWQLHDSVRNKAFWSEFASHKTVTCPSLSKRTISPSWSNEISLASKILSG